MMSIHLTKTVILTSIWHHVSVWPSSQMCDDLTFIKPSANLPYSQRIWNKEIMECSRIFDYFFERLSTFSNVKLNVWQVLYAKFSIFWSLNDRSRSNSKRDIGRQSLKKLMILGSESWNYSNSSGYIEGALIFCFVNSRGEGLFNYA